MKLSASLLTVAVLALPAFAAAQTKTITGEQKTITATVEAIERSSRTVTVKNPDGTYEDLYAPETFKRFDELKVGDRIKATYYENIVLQLKKPGEPAVDTASGGVVRSQGSGPGATASAQRTITATITAIDMKAPSITFAGPNGWRYSGRVEDKEALSKVKVGDRIDITWTSALLLSLE
jgi:Cu/Ag efflux protein CusF